MNTNELEKEQITTFIATLILLFIRPWIINKAIAALISVEITLPVFTYWQMFFISWAFALICRTLGNIFYKKN